MFAVIKDNGKQYRVQAGDSIWVDLKKDTKAGDSVEFDQVLVYSEGRDIKIGAPLVDDVKVVGEIKGDRKSKKLTVMKFRRRKDSRVKNGHRQQYTHVDIKEIVNSGAKQSQAAEPQEEVAQA